jgi:hypothetical protein
LDRLIDSLQFLVSRGVGSNVDELIAKLATVTAWPQLAAMVVTTQRQNGQADSS